MQVFHTILAELPELPNWEKLDWIPLVMAGLRLVVRPLRNVLWLTCYTVFYVLFIVQLFGCNQFGLKVWKINLFRFICFLVLSHSGAKLHFIKFTYLLQIFCQSYTRDSDSSYQFSKIWFIGELNYVAWVKLYSTYWVKLSEILSYSCLVYNPLKSICWYFEILPLYQIYSHWRNI